MGTPGYKQRHGPAHVGNGFRLGTMKPSGKSSALMRGEDDEVGFVFLEVGEDGLQWIGALSVNLLNAKPGFGNVRTMGIRCQETPTRQEFTHAWEVIPMILRTDATHMEQAQERLGSKRETESMGVGIFVTASEVGRMKNPGNMDRGIHVPLKLTHAPISPTQVLLGAEQDLAEAGARAERFTLRHSHEMPLQGGRFRPHSLDSCNSWALCPSPIRGPTS